MIAADKRLRDSVLAIILLPHFTRAGLPTQVPIKRVIYRISCCFTFCRNLNTSYLNGFFFFKPIQIILIELNGSVKLVV